MNHAALIARLESQLALFAPLLAGLSEAQTRWRPAPGAWSVREVVGHLLDEEREDFRVRIRATLEDPVAPWPPLDPEGRVTEHAWNEQSTSATLGAFTVERRASLKWLASLRAPDWERAHVHPKLGRMSAGQLLACWAAHDLLHARQLAKLVVQILGEDAAPADLSYAGRL